MRNKLLLTITSILLWTALASMAQPYRNEWINYGQRYHKIKVAQDGIYRLTTQTLLIAGVDLLNCKHQQLQIWHNGMEDYLHVYDANGNDSLNAGDYIEFYGKKNDGSFDAQLYKNPLWQANTAYSLINDTAIYFITIASNTNNKRYTIETDNNYTAYTPTPYFIHKERVQAVNEYCDGAYTFDIDYTNAEGYLSNGVFSTNGGQHTITLSTQQVYNAGPQASVEIVYAGTNNNYHDVLISGPSISIVDQFSGYETRRINAPIPNSQLAAASTFTIKPNGSFSADRVSWSNVTVTYPHNFNLENKQKFKLLLPNSTAMNKSYIEFNNLAVQSTDPVMVWDITNHKIVPVGQLAGNYQAIIPNDGGLQPKEVIITSASQTVSNAPIGYVNPGSSLPGQFTNFQNVAVDSAFVMISNRKIWSSALAYKAHRDLTTQNRTVLVDVDELYDQYAYGIQKHPLAIKNFTEFLADNWNSAGIHPPQHIFLLGKSIVASDFRNNPTLYANTLVPTYGNPGSDIVMLSGRNGTLYQPIIPVGRLAANDNNDVNEYLNKVREYEAVLNGPPQNWTKEVLHFSGGANINQAQILAAYMDGFKAIIEDTLCGAHVTTYYKNSTQPIVINQSDSLQRRIDAGVALMTFFGHASGSGFDQSTDDPSEYNNQGKYPFITANSCFAGNIHGATPGVSEQFVLQPNKGAIGFIASVALGDAGYLNLYSGNLYQNISVKKYGESMGSIMRQTIIDTQDSFNLGLKTVVTEMQLNGDPSLPLYHWDKPELVMELPNISFNPAEVTTDQSSFDINIITRNWGKAVTDSFYVKIKRTLPSGIDSTYLIKRGKCYYADTLTYTLRNYGFNSGGLNNFEISADLDSNTIAEQSDEFINNKTVAALFVKSSDIIPVYPYKYAIYPYSTVTLRASTANPFAIQRTYNFDISNVDLSKEPMDSASTYYFGSVTTSGGLVSWTPPLSLVDSSVYYWRVWDDSLQYDSVTYRMNQSSFQFIPGKRGWSQADFYQFKENEFKNIVQDSVHEEFDFVVNKKFLDVTNWGSPALPNEYNETGYTLNAQPADYNGCGVTPYVVVAVIDSVTLKPWNNCNNNFGQLNTFTSGDCSVENPVGTGNCRSRYENFFFFRYNQPSEMTAFQNMLNAIPNGNHMIVYSWFPAFYSNYPDFQNAMINIGFSDINLVFDTTPFIFYMQKGNINSETHSFGTTSNQRITLSTLLEGVWNKGSQVSNTIGPSTQWQSLHWLQTPKENIALRDSITLSIYGLNANTNNWDTLRYGIQVPVYDTTLSWIDANLYPYIKIEAYQQDDSLRTPPQMQRWQIYYQDVPEAALNANRSYVFYNNPLNEGDTVKIKIAVDNAGDLAMDSLNMLFYVYDSNGQRHNIKEYKTDSLRTNQFVEAFAVWDDTYGSAGINSLWVEANPFGNAHQLEQYHFNNIAEVKFNVMRDDVNPILDVTFDGVHILDGDIVSGKPNINIQLHDENKFLALNDTSNFRVYLKTPGSNTNQLLSFSQLQYGTTMRFTPAVLPKNSCRIEFNPELLADGRYQLEVEATDKSRNESGKFNYKITFEVVNKSTITEVLNYPNPFSTSTKFVFTLTGNTVPDYFKIQILTVAGRVVKEITQTELGEIHIGRNITDYAWDGKDQFGDQLANGVYLYRVISKINGESIEKRETEADKFFNDGWGKMYLMR